MTRYSAIAIALVGEGRKVKLGLSYGRVTLELATISGYYFTICQ